MATRPTRASRTIRFSSLGADAGPPALLLFLTHDRPDLFPALARARCVETTHAPDSPLIGYTHGMQVALLGFMVSGFFVSRYDLELVYEVAALATALHILARGYEREADVQQLAVAGRQLPVDNSSGARSLGDCRLRIADCRFRNRRQVSNPPTDN
jgi:hypothetical protein